MSFKTYDLIRENNCARSDGYEKISNADKLFARSLAKRQLLIVKDLMAFDKSYPGELDKDVIGGLYALYTLLEDNVESIVSR